MSKKNFRGRSKEMVFIDGVKLNDDCKVIGAQKLSRYAKRGDSYIHVSCGEGKIGRDVLEEICYVLGKKPESYISTEPVAVKRRSHRSKSEVANMSIEQLLKAGNYAFVKFIADMTNTAVEDALNEIVSLYQENFENMLFMLDSSEDEEEEADHE